MGESTRTKNDSTKLGIVTVVIAVLILAAAVTGVYYCAIPSAAAEKATVITNFSDGAWANYSIVYYDINGEVVCPGNMLTYTYADSYNGKDCWIYVENCTWSQVNGTGADIFTYYLDKTSNLTIYQTVDSYANGTLVNSMGYTAVEEGLADNRLIFEGLTVTAKDKSITVPAGTFRTTEETGPVTYESYGLRVYVNDAVPAWGVVEYQYYTNTTMASIYELVTYGL